MGTQWETRGKNRQQGLGTKGLPQKKVLSLVLCVAMLLSVMVMGTGAAFTDEDDFSPQYAEAAEVLTNLKVMQGYDDGSFLPQRNITRAQVATLIYRAATGDVTDSQTDIYSDYDKFDDVQSTDWFAGYVNYCGNAELIKGFTPTTFGPNKNVTGYQVLAMILRAVGYDANDEFTGSGWEIRTASTAQQLGMLDNVQEATLGQPATRELVAELIFQALNVNMVKYMPAAGYVKQDITLGQQEFELTNKGDNHDDWGRPGTLWTYKINNEIESTLVKEDALATYTTAVTECDVATALDFDGTKTFTTYTNGVDNDKDYNVQATDTKGTIGAQGRITEVYEDEIVYIDTLLAFVEDVTPVKYDAAGHVKTPAKLTLNIYDADTNAYTTVVENQNTDWEYTEGQALLVYAVQNTSNKVLKDNDSAKHIEIRGVAPSVVGAQTSIWIRENQHEIDGTIYYDNNRLHRNDAGTDSTKDYIWYLDENNNVIGAAEIAATYSYGILKDMIWNVGTPGNATATLIDPATGAESTVTVNSIDGMTTTDWDSSANNTKPYYDVYDHTNFGAVSNDSSDNGRYNGYALYQVETLADGTVNLDGYDVIGYRHAATITNGATSFAGAGGDGNLQYVDDNTVFTVRTLTADGYTYQQYVGKANVPSFVAGTARTFYVDTDNDKVVEYVYIQDGTLDLSGNAFVMATDDGYQVMKDGSTSYDYLNSAWVGTTLTNSVVKDTSSDGNVRTLAGRVGIPHYVTYADDGSIATIDRFDTTAEKAGTTDDYYVQLRNPGYSGTTLLYDKAVNNQPSYNTTDAAVVGDYTALEDVTDWSDVNVYVVYETTDGVNYASIVYVVNKADNEQDSTADPEKAIINYQVQIVDQYGNPQNTISVATYELDTAWKDKTVSYSDLITAMMNNNAPGWTNVDGAVATLTALGIYKTDQENVSPITVTCDLGDSVTATFVVSK